MNSKIKKFFSAAVFLLVFLLGLSLLYRIFSWKDTSGDYYSSTSQLYSMKKNTVDVAFFGPSAYYASLNPAVFWESRGIASFNAAVSGQDRNASTYYVRELLKTQSPKVVVVSATYLYTDYYAVQGNLLRNTLSLKESKNSFDLIRDLVSKNKDVSGTNGIKDYLLRWPIVHSRYREIKKEDFTGVKENEDCLGYVYDYTANVLEAFGPDSFDTAQLTPISDGTRQWLEELKALGDREGFEVIVVSVPTDLGSGERACLNGCFSYMEEQGIRFLDMNFLLDEMDFQPYYDMADGTHANVNGATKISNYLSDYFDELYSLPDRREQSGYGRYDACLRNYHHKLYAADVLPYADDAQLSDLIGAKNGMIAAVNLRPGETAQEFTALLQNAGATPEEISRGGTWILDDGVLVCRPGDKQYGYPVNASEYLYVTPSGAPGFDDVYVGKTICIAPSVEGSSVVTYDTVLDKIIDVRVLRGAAE